MTTGLRAGGIAVVLGIAAAGTAQADEALGRRGRLGAALAPAEGGGVRIQEVLPRSSAEAGGLKAGDVLRAIDGRPTERVPAVFRAVRDGGGRELAFDLSRDGKAERLAVRLAEWPREPETDAYRVEYGDVASKAGRLRTIALVPKASAPKGRYPALLILQGLGMATLDNPGPGEPVDKPVGMGVYRTIAASLTEAGFVTLRVDKAGCGDSQGDAPALDFLGELDGYRAALKALKARPDVDPDRVFLFGHSMGGVFAPVLAGEAPVRGVAVYGTVFKTWLEYLLENARRQHILTGDDPAMLDVGIRIQERCLHELLVARKAPGAILREIPEAETVRPSIGFDGDQVFGRHYTFFHQLNDVNVPAAWAKVDADVLALWGEAEAVSGRDDHEAIAAIVEATHPGRGSFRVVPKSSHGFDRADSPREALLAATSGGQRGEFNPAILEALRPWMAERAR
jgi:dienelactone hydrolase